MRILFVMDSLGTGGAERSTADLWYFLRASGIEVYIIVLGHRKEGVEREILDAGFHVTFLKKQNLIKQSRIIASTIKMLHPSVVHSILFKSNIRTRLARLHVQFLHLESLVNCSYDKVRLRDPNIRAASFYFYKWLDKVTSRLVNHFHSITHTVKSHYVKELGIDRDKITVVYRGRRPTPKINIDRHAIGIHEPAFLVINTGRHEFQKGQLFIVKAIHKLVEKGYQNIKLIIYGRDGNATRELVKYIEQNNLSRNIILGGYRSDVTAILPLADVFVFPSLYEGLGGALIEAQAAGLPIICNNLPVLKEVIVENLNGRTFLSEDIESICDAILFFYDDSSRRKLFGENSRRNFEEKFNLDKIHNEMLVLYKKLCSL